MKVSRLLSSILGEPWLILPSVADSYLPVIGAWLAGNSIDLGEEKEALEIQAVAAGRISPYSDMEDLASLPEGTIAVVSLKGAMTKYDGWCNYGTQSISRLIHMLAQTDNVTGMVLDIDGPGGAVSAIAPMVQAQQAFMATGKPLVVHADMVASAHYYAAVYSDYFFLDNEISSQAGSIGTLIEYADYAEYWKQKGISIRRIYAPQSTHKNLPFEEAEKGNDEPMKELVLKPLAENFQQAVISRRAKLDQGVEGILNGAMFFGRQAVEYGLADGIGDLQMAIKKVSDMIQVREFMKSF